MKEPFSLLNQIRDYFVKSGESLCVVESCTGGLLSFWLTSLPGASQYFKGALVSYQTDIKIQQLALSPQKIAIQGLVTKDCALSMAQSIRQKFQSDWSISTTGIAGPSKGKSGENIGKTAICVCSPYFQKAVLKQFNDANRQNLRYKVSIFALDFLISGFKYNTEFLSKEEACPE